MSFTIKHVASLVGLTPRTLRYYESVGLLPAPERTSGNYRVYTAADIVDLARIKRLAALGFSLNQIFDIIGDPASQESRQALGELHADLDRQIAELKAKRAAVTQILKTGAPLDVVTEFAEVVSRLHEVYPDAGESELDKMRIDLIAGLGDAADTERMRELLHLTVSQAEDPSFKMLRELDARFAAIGPDAGEKEITDLIAGYADTLTAVYSRLERALPSERARDMLDDLNAGAYNYRQLFVMTQAMAAVRSRLTAAGDPSTPRGKKVI